jgi:hypothetical protein
MHEDEAIVDINHGSSMLDHQCAIDTLEDLPQSYRNEEEHLEEQE